MHVDDTSSYGVVKLDGDKILEFIEKPEAGQAPSNLINAGLYIMEPEVIDLIPEGKSLLEREIFPKISKPGKLYGFVSYGQWLHTGDLKLYEHAKKHWRGVR